MVCWWTFWLLQFGFVGMLNAQEVVNGQIYTPGIALVDAPQPNSPEGGDFLQVAIDITSNGEVRLPQYYLPHDLSEIHNITIFLTSYVTGKNFTITNGTASRNNASLGDILFQESTSSVKYVNWTWPDCLVGSDGVGNSSTRGPYNISIHQNFRVNGTDLYTIFDLPIKVTNSIPANLSRPFCDSLNNKLLTQVELQESADNFTRPVGSGFELSGISKNITSSAPVLERMTPGSLTALWLSIVGLAFILTP